MSRSTKLRIVGFVVVVAVTGIICWQLLPSADAQEQRKLSAETSSSDRKDRRVYVDNPDDILLNARTLSVSAEKQKRETGDQRAVNAVKSGGPRLHLVRFNGPIKSAWTDSLRSKSLAIVDYIPNYTYLVWGDSVAIESLRSASLSASSPIEWEGEYKAEYRIMPKVFVDAKQKTMGLASDRFEIQLFKNERANAETLSLVDSVGRSDIVGKQEISHYVNFVVGLDEDGINKLAQRPDVISIHPYSEPKKYDERQNLILRGNLNGNDPTPGDYLQYLLDRGFTQAQFDASNFIVDVTDSGIGNANPANENQFLLRRLGDPSDTSRVVYSRLEGTPNTGSTLAGCDGHGNINATIIGGYVPSGGIFGIAPHADALGYRYGLGVAPFVKVGSSVIFDPDNFTSPNVSNLQAKAYNDGARISSNSWGADTAGAYTTSSQAFDFLVRDSQRTGSTFPTAGNQEMVIVFAAGNAGPGVSTVGSPGSAKNLITVGASENVHPFGGPDRCGFPDTDANSANDMIGFSSRGPTTDGRKKPDIVLPGTHVTGGAAQNTLANPVAGTGTVLPCFTANGSGVCGGVGNVFFPAGQQWYTASSGTSHSTPAIAGYAALIRQHFINAAPTGGSPGNGTPPSPAMTKALMMNSASYMNGAGANDNLPSNSQGMGLADLENYFDIFDQDSILRDQQPADTFSDSGQERVFSGTIANNAKPFRVTLAYSDAPGSTSGNAFVNDLDLEVIVGGNTYKGNAFLKGASTTGGSVDTRNNVESVFIPAGVSGSFLIRVKATNIAGDGLPDNADTTDQDFALVVWNGESSSVPVISGGDTSFSAESCSLNGAIDPAETVTINFGLSNVGTLNSTNVVATLLATGGVTSPSAPQAYGVLNTGGGQVSRAFTFTASTDCGEELIASFQLQDGATDLGVVSFDFRTGTLAPPTSTNASTGDLATSVPDNTTVEVPIEVSTSGALSDLNVKVRMNHTFDGDVSMSITSPGGLTVPLVAERGGSGDNFGSGANSCDGNFTIFDDSAATAIGSGTAPFTGSFRPESPLAALNGESIEGTWTLSITDSATGDTGLLGCAQLEIERQRFECCGVDPEAELSSGGPPALVSESFIPPNNTPDPGETVTYNIAIVNLGIAPTSNLVVGLENSGGVTPVTTAQNYGVLQPKGSAVIRPFTFMTNGPCGGTVTATFTLQDGAINHGTISHTFQLGVQQSVTENFDAVTVPALPSGWVQNQLVGTGITWTTSTTSPASAPNAAFAPNPGSTNAAALESPAFAVQRSDAQLSFRNNVNTEGGFDGMVLEIKIGAGAWQDILAAGGAFVSGGYNATISTEWESPIAGRPAWTGNSGGYFDTLVSLPPTANGQNVQLRWLMASDVSVSASGVRIDNVQLDVAYTCSTTPGPTDPEPAVRGDFDGDRRSDFAVYRPSTGAWWVKAAGGPAITAISWGINGDIPSPGDFDGDGKTDYAIYRPGAINVFWVLRSEDFTHTAVSWGTNGDVPMVRDYDGDFRDDYAVYRPSENVAYILESDGGIHVYNFGSPGDVPVAGDFDGDQRGDITVYRNGEWITRLSSTGNVVSFLWGLPTDMPVPADYDNDGMDDYAIFRPTDGRWWIVDSSTGQHRVVQWGTNGDVPVPGDYDGDGRYDPAVYRNGVWWVRNSTGGHRVVNFGLSTDLPIEKAYIP